jgi:Zn-dependent protease with chaperone function
VFITAIENFVLFSALFSLAGFACAFLSRLLVLRGFWQPQPFTLTRLYAAALVVPPLIAVWLVAAALLPEWWLGEDAFDAAHSTPMHHLHLLSDLTAQLEPNLAYTTVLFVVSASVFAALSSFRGYARVGRLVHHLEVNPELPPPCQVTLVEEAAHRHGLDVGLVMSDYPFSFVWGFRRSKLVLSSGLLHVLTPEELMGVIEHEAAHHARRDNTVKLALSFASYLSPAFPLSRLILRWRAEQVEMVCDEVAVARTLSPLEIADALLKLRRTANVSATSSMVGSASSAFIHEDAKVFEMRVRRLIAFDDQLPTESRAAALSKTPRAEALLITALFPTTLTIVSALAPMAVHRAAESIIRLFI